MVFSVSLFQLNSAIGHPEANLAKVRSVATIVRDAGSSVLILPELWATGYSPSEAMTWASGPNDGVMAELAEIARISQLTVIGSTLIRNEMGVYNRLTVIDSSGRVVANYDKMHLFGLMDETRSLRAGNQPVVWRGPYGRWGLAICYDLRFAELFRCYARDRVDVLVVPAAWPTSRIEHWKTLLTARAIEEQAFVIGCNRVGVNREVEFGGHSMIISPWGERLIEATGGEELLHFPIDLKRVDEIRRQLPVLDDIRDDWDRKT